MLRIKQIFGTSVDGLRHSYITNLYRDPNNVYKIEETSRMMAHDISTHISYLDKENKNKKRMNMIMIDDDTLRRIKEIGFELIEIK